MNKLIAFHGNPEIKQTYIKRLQDHYNADQIVQGTYWLQGKGCAVGCTIHDHTHISYETELGIPAEVAYLEDAIFEALSNADAVDFPLQFMNAVEIGADLSLVPFKFIYWMLTDKDHGAFSESNEPDEDTLARINQIAGLYKMVAEGLQPASLETDSLLNKSIEYHDSETDVGMFAVRALRYFEDNDGDWMRYATLNIYNDPTKGVISMRDKFLELLANAPILMLEEKKEELSNETP